MNLGNSPELATSNSRVSTTEQASKQNLKYYDVWKRAVYRMKVHKAIHCINEEILLYGTSNNFLDLDQNFKPNLEEIMRIKVNKLEAFRTLHEDDEMKLPWYIIDPESNFSRFWSLVMSILLFYTAIFMPVRVAFFETVYFDSWTILELCIDALFLIDVGINCFLSFEHKDATLEITWKGIILNYLKSWFLIDIIACIPFSLIEYSQNPDENSHSNKYNQLARLARLPRLYKLLRIFRIAKAINKCRKSKIFEKVQDFLHMNSSKT